MTGNMTITEPDVVEALDALIMQHIKTYVLTPRAFLKSVSRGTTNETPKGTTFYTVTYTALLDELRK
jgi:hypothetical protein